MSIENPGFLKEKYSLHTAPEVESAARRTEVRSGERVTQDPATRIQNYLDRLERLALDPDKAQSRKMFGSESRPRALLLLREMVMSKYVRPNKDKMAAGAARVEERAARSLGIEAHYGQPELEERGEIAVADLEKSLDNWISYLSDQNEPYPTWFRYYTFRNILDLGDYDKDKGEFTRRSQGSTRLFPDIDRGALAYVEQMIEAAKDPAMLERLRKAQEATGTPQDRLLTKEHAANFARLSFAKQYTEGIKQTGEITPEMRQETRGHWVRYQQGTDPSALWASLQNKGTAWCTKGFATAETQLQGGDFYVYYTDDRQGKPTIPRIAIRMQGDTIGEVRGVADNDQNLEGNMAAITEAKMAELPGAERYRKASADMKALTAIERIMHKDVSLTAAQLRFLYELDAPVEGFGYKRDPRIAELRSQRNPEADMPIVFDCMPEQIARASADIREDTKAYIGPLEPGIFDHIQEYDIEHIYTSFPERRIRRFSMGIGGRTAQELERELDTTTNFRVRDYARGLLQSRGFTTLKHPERVNLVRLTVQDLGFTRAATIDEINTKTQTLGLEPCPAEVGPHLRLKDTKQPMFGRYLIAMQPIVGLRGRPGIFELMGLDDELWLEDGLARAGQHFGPAQELVVHLRQKKTYNEDRYLDLEEEYHSKQRERMHSV